MSSSRGVVLIQIDRGTLIVPRFSGQLRFSISTVEKTRSSLLGSLMD